MSEPFSKGHILVDLDGTLARYDGWQGSYAIGEPIPAMVNRVKKWLAEGKEVRIFTARVSVVDHDIRPIEDWCQLHLGQSLKVVCCKDYQTTEIWDDRSIGVIPNLGVTHESVPALHLLSLIKLSGANIESGVQYGPATAFAEAKFKRVMEGLSDALSLIDAANDALSYIKPALAGPAGDADLARAKATVAKALTALKTINA